ncbi:hypothetical protein TG4357_00351 [Thalassovita gelatinovora]|uniref:Uncharacterized protein n=1 Tax=Thalassovita gelatinovora TaxID=53501 RepID=A0A0P1F4W8_THAGE|nr:hypothetical protein TG4357_00351 [Thalassovita gelatinovora]
MGGDVFQQGMGQVAIKRDQPFIRRSTGPKWPIEQRLQDLVACGFQRQRIGNRRDQPVGTFDCHILIGRQIVGPIDMGGVDAKPLAGRQQVVAFHIAADGG